MLLFSEFDIATTLTNFGGLGFALWLFYQMRQSDMTMIRAELVKERERADKAVSDERLRCDQLQAVQFDRFDRQSKYEREVWGDAIEKVIGRIDSLELTVRETFDAKKAIQHITVPASIRTE